MPRRSEDERKTLEYFRERNDPDDPGAKNLSRILHRKRYEKAEFGHFEKRVERAGERLEKFLKEQEKDHHTPGDGTGMDASGVPSENALTAEHGPARRR